MSNETMVTLQGYVGGDVQLRRVGETCVANIRVACTPRRYQRRSDEWVNAETQWYTVNAWRALGEHCERSLRRGDPVIVHGRLNARTYVNKNNIEVTAFEVEAVMVGHDLNRGVSQFIRVPRPQAAEPNAAAPAREREEAAATTPATAA
ncbi:MAG: single-stranded DNA-binding protein [Actinomycetota bacterium]|nr:single-stranded DNA-binding protein [Actinomycetota bacterium]